MKNLSTLFVTIVASALLSSPAFAAGGHGAVTDKIHLNMNDKASLQNGAKLFVNYCLSCHSASYARYNRVAEDLEIPVELLKSNLMFTTEKTGDLMITTMPEEDSKRWFGVTPPDLTLVSRVRKPEWVYTYLRAFYQDESSPSGWNNSLFENVAMPHAMYELQGVQRLVGKVVDQGAGAAHASEASGNTRIVGDAEFELVHKGKLTPDEFDVAMIDLTSFLVYLAEPAQMQRKKIGVFTLAFLIILMGLTYLLKKEYWRDVH
ncbi:MAG: ubiquinol-cytochrome c reductase cytochrome c1 subunit [Cryomorphaceae bacterium]|jgi:ubiquinol-cytochrome c reductase cytochrome c1 subunit